MHKATIVSRGRISGDHNIEVMDEDISIFHAKIVGAVQGATAAGSTILSIATEWVDA